MTWVLAAAGFAARQAERVLQLFVPDSGVVMVTSEESLLRGPDECGPFLPATRRGHQVLMEGGRRDVSAVGAVGWLLAEGVETAAADRHEEQHPYGMSMVCERRDARWLLVQSMAPLPIRAS